MELRERYEDILLLGKELSLYMLEVFQKESNKAKKNEDFDKFKKLQEDFIPKFEKFYFEFSLEIGDEFDRLEIEKVENIVNKLIEEYNLDEEILWVRVRKRLELEGNSGAEVVKKLFEVKLKELQEKLSEMLDLEYKFSKIQKELEKELADVIQQEEEAEIFEKIIAHGKKIDLLDTKIQKIEAKIYELQYNIESKWQYEIYGLVSKETLYTEVKK